MLTWSFRTSLAWAIALGALGPWGPGPWGPGALGPWGPAPMVPWIPGALGPRIPWAPDPGAEDMASLEEQRGGARKEMNGEGERGRKTGEAIQDSSAKLLNRSKVKKKGKRSFSPHE